MRIGFIQLPVPGHHAPYARANRPLAAAYMIAFARRHCRRTDWDAEILPDGLSNYGGDAAILHWMRHGRFDALFFTLYLWNRQRSLFLAQAIKQHQPAILIAGGGPEVTSDQALSDFPGVDLLCVGEGEEFVARLVDDALFPGIQGMHCMADITDLAKIPDPYQSGLLPIRQGDIIHFEQMRGCSRRCAYCYYGKGRRSVRRFPSDRVPEIFRLASAFDRTELYFMDPTFNSREGLAQHLDWIAQSNPQVIPIHTEVRLELIDRSVADGMAAAGIRSVEAGLQSVNPKALAAVGRRWHRDGFLHGARLLRERGIEIRTGIILGLPEDSLDDFLTTLDFLESAGLSTTMECFILAILPGTALRRQLHRWQMQAMPQPPYWVQATSRMRAEDFAAAIQILERRNGIEYFPPIPPLGPPSPVEFRSIIDLRPMDLALDPGPILHPEEMANSITLIVDSRTAQHARLAHWADYLLSAAPHTCWRILHPGNELWPPQLWHRLRRLFLLPQHYVNRSHSLYGDPQPAFSVRLFQVTDDIASARRLLDVPQEAEMILHPRPGQVSGWDCVCREAPWMLIDPQMAESERAMIAAWYANRPERLMSLPHSLW